MAWRYTCNIPTFITGKDENGEPVVLYRVNVLFQQASQDEKSDAGGSVQTDTAPFFVLRRYSQFRHLHDQLKAALPSVMSGRGMAPPPKHSLVLGDKRDALERRRSELERWLWRLVGTAEVARGSQLKAFLEFDKALARVQQQQARRRMEQQRLLEGTSLPLHDLDSARGASPSTPPSEAGFATGATARNHLATYPGGAGDDSASDASGPSVIASTTGGAPGLGWSGSLEPLQPSTSGAPDPRAHPHRLPHPRQRSRGVGGEGGGGGGGAPAPPAGSAAMYDRGGGGGSAAAAPATAQLARLGIHLQSRADVRRLVDLLVQRLEVACSEASAAAGEVSLLRDANRDMAQRLGELELERAGEGPAAELRHRLAESEAARSSLDLRVTQLEETLAGRGAAHTAQVSQLQSQLSESRSENSELLRRLADWDVGANPAAATAAAEQRAAAAEAATAELRRQVDEARQRAQEQEGLLGERAAQLAEAERRCREREAEASERARREAAEAAAAAAAAAASAVPAPPSPHPPPPQHQHQAQLDRARADNALLAQEVQRLRAVVAHDREAARAAAAAAASQLEALRARVQQQEGAGAVPGSESSGNGAGNGSVGAGAGGAGDGGAAVASGMGQGLVPGSGVGSEGPQKLMAGGGSEPWHGQGQRQGQGLVLTGTGPHTGTAGQPAGGQGLGREPGQGQADGLL